MEPLIRYCPMCNRQTAIAVDANHEPFVVRCCAVCGHVFTVSERPYHGKRIVSK